MNHPDFRVRGGVFATLWQARGVVVLTPEQQAMLADADPASVRSALMMAWRHKATCSLASPP